MVRILTVFLILVSSSSAFGAGFVKVGTFAYTYDGIFTGARSNALGQADLAGAFGPGATQTNTAPLPLGGGVEASYERNQYVLGMDMAIWGGAAEYGGFRLGFSQLKFMVDPYEQRTAYQPEGTGEIVEAGDDINVLSLGYDLGRLLDDEGAWNWTVGAAWRGYRTFEGSDNYSGDTFDLGTTVAWTSRYAEGWTRLAAAFSWQNVFDETMSFDERESALPGSQRLGFTAESAFGQAGWGTEAFKALVAYSRRVYTGTWGDFRDDADHYGLEMTAAGTFAFRVGHNGRWDGAETTWGVGLVMAQDFMGPWTLSADYGRYPFPLSGISDSGELEMWSVRARYAF